MKFSTLLRHVREGAKSIWRNGWMSFASISSMFISLIILGIFMLLAMNMNHIADQFESKVQIRVYLQMDVTEEKITELQNKIGNLSEVSKVTLVTKEEGLEMLRKAMGEENMGLLEGYEDDKNPLPFSFTIEVYDPQTVEQTAEQISSINRLDGDEPIHRIKYGQGTVEKLFKITNTVRNVGFIIVIGLAITAIFLISNTIKMTIVARRREIGIMKLVGATNAFIRWPFFIEGALIGILSSVITAVVIWLGYAEIFKLMQLDLSLLMISMVPVRDAMYITSITLIALGSVIGIWGSTISVRKYLKV